MNITNDGTPYPFAMGPTDKGTKLEINNMAEQNDKQKQLLTKVMNADAKDGLYKQQTAVEWLIDQLKGYEYDGKDFTFHGVITSDLVEQAKKMEKEQIIKSFSVGNDCGYRFAITEDSQQFNSCKQYFDETYGGAE